MKLRFLLPLTAALAAVVCIQPLPALAALVEVNSSSDSVAEAPGLLPRVSERFSMKIGRDRPGIRGRIAARKARRLAKRALKKNQPVSPKSKPANGSQSTNDQELADQQAIYRAANQIKGHVGQSIGLFEGVGYSSSSSLPPTCTPGRNMTLTADAVARGDDGWYRVRAWR